jgi:hypothetical protein
VTPIQDLFKLIAKASIKIIDYDSPVPEIARLLTSTMTDSLLNELKYASKNVPKGMGKGGNTNCSEVLLKEAFKQLNIPDIVFHPNGSQKFPDVILKNVKDIRGFPTIYQDYYVEWKSVSSKSNSFMFNDTFPKGWAYYYLCSRAEKKVLAVKGDILCLGGDPKKSTDVWDLVSMARKTGKTFKKEGDLVNCFPRINVSVRNFLLYAPSNGWYDYDMNTIWAPSNDS